MGGGNVDVSSKNKEAHSGISWTLSPLDDKKMLITKLTTSMYLKGLNSAVCSENFYGKIQVFLAGNKV